MMGFLCSVPQRERNAKIWLTLAIGILILSACQTQQKSDSVTIRIHEESFIQVKLDTLLNYSSIMPLEYTPEALLEEGGTVVFNEDGYFISGLRRPLYHFDPSGKFVKKIGSVGKGPGEYTSALEVVVNQEGIVFLESTGPTKLLYYNQQGDYLESQQLLDKGSADFAVHPQNGDYYFFSTLLPDLLYRVDRTSHQVIASFMASNEPPIHSVYNAFFINTQGELLFRNPRNQRIYAIEEDSAILKYQFDYGDQYPDFAALTMEERSEMTNYGETWLIYDFVENESWMYLMVRNQNNTPGAESEIHHLILRKSDQSIYRLPGSLKTMELFYPAGFYLDENNILYIPISPTFLMDQETWLHYFKLKGIDFNLDGNWLIVKIPLDEVFNEL